MTTDLSDEIDSEADDRYATLQTEDDRLVIYDREEPNAWIKSDVVLEPWV